jgi:hypothetical protein
VQGQESQSGEIPQKRSKQKPTMAVGRRVDNGGSTKFRRQPENQITKVGNGDVERLRTRKPQETVATIARGDSRSAATVDQDRRSTAVADPKQIKSTMESTNNNGARAVEAQRVCSASSQQ